MSMHFKQGFWETRCCNQNGEENKDGERCWTMHVCIDQVTVSWEDFWGRIGRFLSGSKSDRLRVDIFNFGRALMEFGYILGNSYDMMCNLSWSLERQTSCFSSSAGLTVTSSRLPSFSDLAWEQAPRSPTTVLGSVFSSVLVWYMIDRRQEWYQRTYSRVSKL